jgi:hypothetical protein
MTYLTDHYACFNNQYQALHNCYNLSQQQWNLLCHIFVGGIVSSYKDDEGFIPISSLFFKEHFKKSNPWLELEEKGLVEVTGYSNQYKKCRRFKVSDSVYQLFFDNRPEPGTDFRVNLITGKKTVRRGKTSHYDRSRHKHPIDIINSI